MQAFPSSEICYITGGTDLYSCWFYICQKLIYVHVYVTMHVQAQIQKFFKRGVEEDNLERKMFVDTRINACTYKN